MAQFYFIKNSYYAQIERSGINFRIGYTCMGLRLIPIKYWRGQSRNIPVIFKLLIPISVGINYNSSQAGQWHRFRLDLGCFSFGYITKGERKEKSDYGFYFTFRYNWKNASTRPCFYKIF